LSDFIASAYKAINNSLHEKWSFPPCKSCCDARADSTSSWEIFSYLRLLDHIMSAMSSAEDLSKASGQGSKRVRV